jgi:hypothetical protein
VQPKEEARIAVPDEPVVVRLTPQALRRRVVLAQLRGAAAAWIPALAAAAARTLHRLPGVPASRALALVGALAAGALVADAVYALRARLGARQLQQQYPEQQVWEPPSPEGLPEAWSENPLLALQQQLVGDYPVSTEQGRLERHARHRVSVQLSPGLLVVGVGILQHQGGPSGDYGVLLELLDPEGRVAAQDQGRWGMFLRHAVARPGTWVLQLGCSAGQSLEYLMIWQLQPAALEIWSPPRAPVG